MTKIFRTHTTWAERARRGATPGEGRPTISDELTSGETLQTPNVDTPATDGSSSSSSHLGGCVPLSRSTSDKTNALTQSAMANCGKEIPRFIRMEYGDINFFCFSLNRHSPGS